MREDESLLASPPDSEESLSAFLDSAVEGIVTTGEDGVIRSFNPAAERIFGYDSDEVVGKKVNVLMPAPNRKKHGRYVSVRRNIDSPAHSRPAQPWPGSGIAAVSANGRKIHS